MTSGVRVVPRSAIHWSFKDSSGDPTIYLRSPSGYQLTTRVDPFPAYGHDPAIVREALAHVEAAYPLPRRRQPTIHVLPFEELSRTNGWTDIDYDYTDRKRTDFRSMIVFSGKRIPPHPAMTRYLVAHEYGHVVERHIRLAVGLPEFEDGGRFDREYAALRGMRRERSYGGGTWHATTGEVFACDFRWIATSLEREFWPHPGVARPDQVPAVLDWWAEIGLPAVSRPALLPGSDAAT